MSIRLLFAFLLFLPSLHAQNSAFETLHRGYVTLGLNGGLSYQSSDVRARFDGYGLGLTLAKNLYYHPASPITFDLRGRFLYARQYGLDGKRSFNIADHPALNGTFGLDYLNYPAELGVNQGFVYHNHRTTVGELAGEAVLSWHSDRLGPGVFVSLFGGLGIGVYDARIDQADRFGAPYYEAYANVEGSARRIRRELKNNVLDGNYETLPDPFNRGGAGFMPSLGLEAGIQLTPHFAIAAGHRVTFSGTDMLDGNQWAGTGNDLYHYTSLELKFTFPQRAKRERGRAPNITITYPSGSPFNSNTSAGLVRARVANVQSPADILCTVNGQTFPFDFYAGELTISFPLVPGRNDVNIQASNPFGRDLKRVQIIFQTGGGIINPPMPPPPPPSGTRPSVQITQPSNSASNTQKPTASIQATVRGVGGASEITYTVNGRRTSGFNYNPGTAIFTHLLTLQEGENTVTIRAENSQGTDQASVRITYEKTGTPPPPPPPPGEPPVVNIVQPAEANTSTERSTASVRAALQRVSRTSDITYTVNGRRITNFRYTASTGVFTHTATLREGENTITVKGVNPFGSDEATVRIVYQKPTPVEPAPPPAAPKPAVTFTMPGQAGASAQRSPYEVRAQIENAQPRDVSFKVNGRGVSNFQFDPATGQFRSTVELREGQNDFEINVSNRGGSASASTNVVFRKPALVSPGQKPEITITSISQPASNPLNPNQGSSSIQATIRNVDRKEQISFTVNGKAMNDFSYDARTGAFSATLLLQRGTNELVLKATTRGGSAEQRRNIDF